MPIRVNPPSCFADNQPMTEDQEIRAWSVLAAAIIKLNIDDAKGHLPAYFDKAKEIERFIRNDGENIQERPPPATTDTWRANST